MNNLELATQYFFYSVSGGVFPEIFRWNYTVDVDGGIAELVQVSEVEKYEESVLVNLEFYPEYVAVLIYNADKSIDKIVNRLFYSFCGYGIDTFIEVAVMPDIHNSQRIPTSLTKKEIMDIEIKELEESISFYSDESAKIEKILNLRRGVGLYEQFIINTQNKHLI